MHLLVPGYNDQIVIFLSELFLQEIKGTFLMSCHLKDLVKFVEEINTITVWAAVMPNDFRFNTVNLTHCDLFVPNERKEQDFIFAEKIGGNSRVYTDQAPGVLLINFQVTIV